MTKKYLIVSHKNLDGIQEGINEGAGLGYRVVTMFPVYTPTKHGQELFGYVALLEAD